MTAAALLATAPFAYRWRRHRAMAAMISGGWLAMLVGLLIGPGGLNLIAPTTLLESYPLLTTGLGWIGLMVGLQLRRDVVRALPGAVLRTAAWDLGFSVLVFGSAGTALLWWWWRNTPEAPIVEGATVLAAAALGWSMETRSLRRGGAGDERAAMVIRATGSLGAVGSILIYGFGMAIERRMEGAAPDLWAAVLVAGLVLALAVFMGVAGRFMLSLAGKRPEHQLAVFLGMVAFMAGVAVELRVPAILAALLTGAVMANLQGIDLRRFERFILAAEHALAVMFAIVAGVFVDPMIGWWGAAVACAIMLLRLAIKPRTPRLAQRGHDDMPARSAVYGGAVRQGPIAVVIAVAFVMAHPTRHAQQLLAVVALTGMVCEIVGMMRRGRPLEPSAGTEVAP